MNGPCVTTRRRTTLKTIANGYISPRVRMRSVLPATRIAALPLAPGRLIREASVPPPGDSRARHSSPLRNSPLAYEK
jgi:hypothetical protein